MPRRLAEEKLSPEAQAVTQKLYPETVDEVSQAVAQNPVVVVGMAQNPFVGKARALLTQEGIPFKYLGYGSYFSEYRRRLAIKIWAGYPLLPMVFLDGVLIGGFEELKKLHEAGVLKKRVLPVSAPSGS